MPSAKLAQISSPTPDHEQDPWGPPGTLPTLSNTYRPVAGSHSLKQPRTQPATQHRAFKASADPPASRQRSRPTDLVHLTVHSSLSTLRCHMTMRLNVCCSLYMHKSPQSLHGGRCLSMVIDTSCMGRPVRRCVLMGARPSLSANQTNIRAKQRETRPAAQSHVYL